MYHTVTEEGSNIVIAVIKSKKDKVKRNNKLKKLVNKAVKEEWSYKTVELVEWNYEQYVTNQMSFDCVTEDGDEEIRIVDLNKTTLYK